MTDNYQKIDIFSVMGMDEELKKIEVKKESPKQIAKKRAKEKADNKAKRIATSKPKESDTIRVGKVFYVGDITAETRVLINMTSEEILLGEWFPEYFETNGEALPKTKDKSQDKAAESCETKSQTDNDNLGIEVDNQEYRKETDEVLDENKNESDKQTISYENTSLLLDCTGKEEGTSESETELSEKKNGEKSGTSKVKEQNPKNKTNDKIEAKLTPEIVRKKLAEEWPQFQSRQMVSFTIVRKINCLYAIIAAGPKGNSPFNQSELFPEKLSISFINEFLERAKEVWMSEGSEVQWDLYWDFKTDEYVWDEPDQVRTKTRVFPETNFDMQMELIRMNKGDKNEESQLRLRYRFVGSIHSHHIYPPRMSSVDLESQRTFHLYGILGSFPHNKGSVESLNSKFINEDTLNFSTYYENQHHLIPFSEVIEND